MHGVSVMQVLVSPVSCYHHHIVSPVQSLRLWSLDYTHANGGQVVFVSCLFDIV
jgi:hypothetical protein